MCPGDWVLIDIYLIKLPEMLAVGGPLNAQGGNAKFTERWSLTKDQATQY